MKKNNFLWSIIVIIITISITSVTVIAKNINNSDENEILKSKVRGEMNYLDGKISSMINSLNNITLSNYIVEERQIDTDEGELESNKNTEESQNSSSSDSGSASSSQGGSSNSSEQSNQSKEPKNITEMVSNSILNNDKNIDWGKMKFTVEELQSSWATILLDLYKLDINKDDILNFGTLLDQLTLNVKNEKKIESLDSLTQMYSCIVGYIHSFENDELYKNVAKTREAIFYAYANADKDNWDEVQVQLQNAENVYITVVNNIENKEKEFTINKAYITLKELQNGISENDKDIFYIKYKNVLEELNILMG